MIVLLLLSSPARQSASGGGEGQGEGAVQVISPSPQPSPPPEADSREGEGDFIPRKILAFYDAGNVEDIFLTPLHQHAEMPLNYLGMELVYRDVNRPLPSDAEMAGVRGIITWFTRRDDVRDSADYCRWADRQMQQGRKMVILGRLGFFSEDVRPMVPACRSMLRTLGVQYLGSPTETRYFMDIVTKDATMVEFEHPLAPTDDFKYVQFRVVDPRARVYLKMRRSDSPDSDSALVMTSAHGGLAYDTFVNIGQEEGGRLHWRINPFRFFEEAFHLQGLPRPDATTLNGRRIFYSHIDGDGIFNISHIDQKTYSGEIIYEQILKPNPDIPISASIIAGYLALPQYTGAREMALYRNIFSLPNVEPATHGYAHPLVWRDQQLTMINPRYKNEDNKRVALDIPGYTYSVDQEVRGAVELTRGLLQKLDIAKEVRLYQWTGDCLLPPEALASAAAARVWNMNGGDTRFDHQFESYSFVFPLGINVGGRRQIYTSMSNENTYTNLWEGPYYGYGEVLQSFENTGAPRRVKPVNVYYHYYSGERLAALEAVKQAYQYARTHPLFPIPASRYPRIVMDFFATRLKPVDGGWRVETGGELRTIRFDGERRNVDMTRSRGVLGFVHELGNLYVSLDDGRDHHIVLTSAVPRTPYMMHATFDVRAFRREGGVLRFEKSGWMKSEMTLGGLRPNTVYRVTAGGSTGHIRSTPRGELAVVFPHSEQGQRFQEVVVQP